MREENRSNVISWDTLYSEIPHDTGTSWHRKFVKFTRACTSRVNSRDIRAKSTIESRIVRIHFACTLR